MHHILWEWKLGKGTMKWSEMNHQKRSRNQIRDFWRLHTPMNGDISNIPQRLLQNRRGVIERDLYHWKAEKTLTPNTYSTFDLDVWFSRKKFVPPYRHVKNISCAGGSDAVWDGEERNTTYIFGITVFSAFHESHVGVVAEAGKSKSAV